MQYVKKKLYILTDAFPYGMGEKTFIQPEIEKLKEFFQIILISGASSQLAKKKELITDIDGSIKVFRFCPEESGTFSFYKLFLLFWIKKECWGEVKDIIKSHKKILLKTWKAMYFFARAERLYRWIEDNNIIEDDKGIFYSYWYNDRVLAMTMHKNKYPQMKIITRTHGYDLFHEQVVRTFRQPFKRIMDLAVDNVIFASDYGHQYYLNMMKAVSNPKYVIYRIGAPKAFLQPENKKHKFFRIVSCSNIIPLKRVSLIVDSLSEIKNIDIQWIHFGDGKDKNDIEEYAERKLKRQKNISYQLEGYVNRDALYDYYTNNYVDCFMTLSSSEGGCPVSIQEALAFGIPVIGTAVGGISEMIDGNGYLLNSNPSSKEVADKIQHMAGLDEETYQSMRRRSLQLWEDRYNQIENVEKFLRFLLNL